MAFENIVVSTDGAVAFIQLNRPKVMNALNGALMTEVGDAMEQFDKDAAIRCMIIHGSDRAFSAGADIDQMKSATPLVMLESNWINRNFDRIRKVSKPVIAAVSGYCLGGGAELAMSCDMMIASETAKFGQPEISIGIIPGAGGTQRLARAIGKSRAMELILTGKFMDAKEAEMRGLVSRVFPAEVYLDEAKKLAQDIASKPPVAVRFAKEAVNKVYELSLTEGLEYESRIFQMLFSTEDQKEGMEAFLAKRKPEWKGK
ncbi:MAG: enoyl-CoA hydratase/isomerase family protein [Chloroflexi bacterium]|nr:enoyl-CoA hydratase/isomerase family protein [Chloroflexota bacterium]